MSIKTYLTHLKKALQERSIKPMRFVTGNQSADMDSIVSALVYAKLANLHNNNSQFIPLINIPRADLRLRRDIVALMQAHSITEDLLYFVEDFEKLAKDTKVDVVLVDHCNIQGNELYNQLKAGLLNVVGIIDHHADEGVFLDATPRIIQTNGSCSCLVFNYWYKQLGSDVSLFEKPENRDVVEILVGPLLIDTTNLTAKVEQGDLDAAQIYKRVMEESPILSNLVNFNATDLGVDPSDKFTSIYKYLKSAKKDLSGFSFQDILRKDYKLFDFKDYSVGFSSIGKPISWVVKNFSNSEISSSLSKMIKDEKLTLLVITSSYTRKSDNEYAREFAYFYPNLDEQDPKLTELHKLVESALLLNENLYKLDLTDVKVSEGRFRVYNQLNLAASRKQVVPAVKAVLEK